MKNLLIVFLLSVVGGAWGQTIARLDMNSNMALSYFGTYNNTGSTKYTSPATISSAAPTVAYMYFKDVVNAASSPFSAKLMIILTTGAVDSIPGTINGKTNGSGTAVDAYGWVPNPSEATRTYGTRTIGGSNGVVLKTLSTTTAIATNGNQINVGAANAVVYSTDLVPYDQSMPDVLSLTPTNILATSASLQGSIQNQSAASMAISSSGFYYSTSNTVGYINSTTTNGTTINSSPSLASVAANSTSTFSATANSLTANTVYYYRSFAVVGGVTYQGEIKSFTTASCITSAGTLSGTQAVCSNGTTTFSSTVAGGSWSSGTPSIATIISATGAITPVSAGTATMTYTITGTGGCANVTATRTVTVTAAPSAGTLSGTQAVCSNGTTTFSSTVAGGSWSSGTPSIATIVSGTGAITPVAAGTATMTYTVTGTGGCANVTATRDVIVTAAPSAGTLSGTQAVCSNGTTTFSSTVAGGSWSSGTPSIATIVSGTGAITPVAAGTATMTYTVTGTGGCANVTATRDVIVTAAPSAGTLSGTQAVCSNGTTTFSSTVAGGSWSSGTPSIATIISGTGAITPVAAGTATMTYTVTGAGGCANVTATRDVTVNLLPNPISGYATVLNTDDKVPFTSTTSSGTWSSSNSNVATINSSTGELDAVAIGTTTVSYTVNGCSQDYLVNVIENTGSFTSGSTTIHGTVDLGSTATVSSGAELIISTNARVTVATLENSGTLVIEDHGRLKYDTIIGTGTVEFTCDYGPRNYYCGTTTSGMTIESLTTRSGGTAIISQYNEGTKQYSQVSSGSFVLGRGYALQNPASTSTHTGSFVNGFNYNVTRTYTAGLSGLGYNLLSNPYPASLDLALFYNAASSYGSAKSIQPTAWIRTRTSGGNWGWETVSMVDPLLLNTSSHDNGTNDRYYIPSFQGFFVRVVSGATSGSVKFHPTQTTVDASGQNTLRSTSAITSVARLSVSFGTQSDRCVAALSPQATNGYDLYDSEKMFETGRVQMYFPNSGNKFVINTQKDDKAKVSMPLVIECPGSGEYKLNLENFITTNGLLILEDKLEGTFKDFSLDTSYTFFANAGVLSNRFVLHFHNPSNITNLAAPSELQDLLNISSEPVIEIVSTSTGKVSITLSNELEVNSEIFVSDVNGRLIDHFTSNDFDFDFNIQNGHGVYFVEVRSGNVVNKKKVFVQ